MQGLRSFLPAGIATTLILIAGLMSLYLGTQGGSAWTAETARRLAVSNEPIELGYHTLTTVLSGDITLALHEKPILVIHFIYTTCPAVCLSMGTQFNFLQQRLHDEGLEDQVQLLSITFDQAVDDVDALGLYLNRFHADDRLWNAGRFANEADLRETLERLGVIVIPEPELGFVHNAAVYLAEEGKVFSILDFDNQQIIIDKIKSRLGKPA